MLSYFSKKYSNHICNPSGEAVYPRFEFIGHISQPRLSLRIIEMKQQTLKGPIFHIMLSTSTRCTPNLIEMLSPLRAEAGVSATGKCQNVTVQT